MEVFLCSFKVWIVGNRICSFLFDFEFEIKVITFLLASLFHFITGEIKLISKVQREVTHQESSHLQTFHHLTLLHKIYLNFEKSSSNLSVTQWFLIVDEILRYISLLTIEPNILRFLFTYISFFGKIPFCPNHWLRDVLKLVNVSILKANSQRTTETWTEQKETLKGLESFCC